MANKTIGDLSVAATLTGSENIPIQQSGSSVITTPEDLKTYMAQSAPVSYVPTITGFGTVSAVTAYYWYSAGGSVGNFEIIFTSGISTAVEARASLPFTSASTYPTLQTCGGVLVDSGTATYAAMIEASKAYIVFSRQTDGGAVGLAKRNGNMIASNGETVSIRGTVRLA